MKYFLVDSRTEDTVENGVTIGRKASVNLAFKPYPYYIIDHSPMTQKGQQIIQCWEEAPDLPQITLEEAQAICNEWFRVKEGLAEGEELAIIKGENPDGSFIVHRPQDVAHFQDPYYKNYVDELRKKL